MRVASISRCSYCKCGNIFRVFVAYSKMGDSNVKAKFSLVKAATATALKSRFTRAASLALKFSARISSQVRRFTCTQAAISACSIIGISLGEMLIFSTRKLFLGSPSGSFSTNCSYLQESGWGLKLPMEMLQKRPNLRQRPRRTRSDEFGF